jgi:hypothetical protein
MPRAAQPWEIMRPALRRALGEKRGGSWWSERGEGFSHQLHRLVISRAGEKGQPVRPLTDQQNIPSLLMIA